MSIQRITNLKTIYLVNHLLRTPRRRMCRCLIRGLLLLGTFVWQWYLHWRPRCVGWAPPALHPAPDCFLTVDLLPHLGIEPGTFRFQGLCDTGLVCSSSCCNPVVLCLLALVDTVRLVMGRINSMSASFSITMRLWLGHYLVKHLLRTPRRIMCVDASPEDYYF